MVKSVAASFLETRWVLLGVLLVFVCFKLPHLSYPFYCDEGWVYAPAVKSMAIHGPSLVPGSISSGYSRGHPLFFHFLCAIWIKCFGFSNVSLHSFPLFISVLCLVALYECCRNLFNARVATLALLLITTQVIFFVQASFVEMEVMVTLLACLSLYCYVNDRLLLTTIVLSVLFLTKESGLVFGTVIGTDAVVALFRRNETMRHRVFRLFAVTVSVVPVGIFFLWQKKIEGWYLLPLHSSLIQTGRDHLYFMFRECLKWTFQGGSAGDSLLGFIILLSVVPGIRHRNIRYLFLCLPAIIVTILTDKWIAEHTNGIAWIVLFVLFFSAAFYAPLYFNRSMSKQAQKFVVLLGCCFGLYLCFSSLSVLTFRYLLVEIVMLLIFLAVCIDIFIVAGASVLYPIAIAGILITGALAFYNDKGNDDTDLEAFHAMKVQKDVVSWLEKSNAYDKEVTMGSFWEEVHLIDTTQGFLSSGRVFTRFSWDTAGTQTDYAVFDNICYSNTYERMVKNSAFYLVYRTQSGRTWAEIYKHR